MALVFLCFTAMLLLTSNKYSVCFYANSHWHAQLSSLKVCCTRCNMKNRKKTTWNQTHFQRTACDNALVAHLFIMLTCAFIMNRAMFEHVNHNNVERLTHLHCRNISRSANSQIPLVRTQHCKMQHSVWDSKDPKLMTFLDVIISEYLINYTIKSKQSIFCHVLLLWSKSHKIKYEHIILSIHLFVIVIGY